MLYSLVGAFLVSSSALLGQSIDRNKHGFYLPRNIGKCVSELDNAFSKSTKEKFRKLPESKVEKVCGVFIIEEWGDSTSRTVEYFNSLGIYNWGECQYLTLLAYHQKLNNRSFDIKPEAGKLVDERDSLAELTRLQQQKDIASDRIDGVYIPKDLVECYRELDKKLDAASKQKLKFSPDLAEFHFGVGLWIRNDWGLWGGSRLQQYFSERGVEHPDDKSGIILYGYQKYLNGIPVRADEIIGLKKKEAEEFRKKFMPPERQLEKFYSQPQSYRKFLKSKKIIDFEVAE